MDESLFKKWRTGVVWGSAFQDIVALLTIYYMCKSVDRGMVIGDVKLVEKTGGKSGTWVAEKQALTFKTITRD